MTVRALPDGIILRDLSGMAEFRAAERLQNAVWGDDDLVDPGDLMMVIQHEGGLTAGAFRGDMLLGYVFGFPTRKVAVQHSHRLAVVPQARGLGLALALKWHQRDWCLARGITLVRWTYDPLRHANANLNIARLGARVSTYYNDYYGPMDGINKGTPSDRLLAIWQLDAPHVARLAAGIEERGAGLANPSGTALHLAIPQDFGAMLQSDPQAALETRLAARQFLVAQFDAGYEIRGYDAKSRSYLLFRD